MDDDWLLLVGGVTDRIGHCAADIIAIHLTNGSTKQLSLDEIGTIDKVEVGDWHPSMLLINHSSHLIDDTLFIVGGGGNCFSFGTLFNYPIVAIEHLRSVIHF